MGDKLRTAVVFVHGQGEHAPMGSAPELARTAWATDPDSESDGHVLIAPDTGMEGDSESPAASASGPSVERVQFFEFYWSHLMIGNQLAHVLRWFDRMIKKDRRQTPEPIVGIRQGILRVAEAGVVLAAAYAFLVASLFAWSNDWYQEASRNYDGRTVTYNETADPASRVSEPLNPATNCELRISHVFDDFSCNDARTALYSDVSRARFLYDEALLPYAAELTPEGEDPANYVWLAEFNISYVSEQNIIEEGNLNKERAFKARERYVRAIEQGGYVNKALLMFLMPALILVSFIVLLIYESESRGRKASGEKPLHKRIISVLLRALVRLGVLVGGIVVIGFAMMLLAQDPDTNPVGRVGDYASVIAMIGIGFVAFYTLSSLLWLVRMALRVIRLDKPIGKFTKSIGAPVAFLLVAVILPLIFVMVSEHAAEADSRMFVTQFLYWLGFAAVIALWMRRLRVALLIAAVITPVAVVAAVSGLDLMIWGDVGDAFWPSQKGDRSYITPGWAPPFLAETYSIILFYFAIWAVISLTVDRIWPRVIAMVVVSFLVTLAFYFVGAQNPEIIVWQMHSVLWVWTVVVLLAFVGVAHAFWIASRSFLVPTMADTARYLSSKPSEIERRRAILEQGVRLLDGLHRSRRFDRIVVVAHSLGSIVAYDLLTRYWARRAGACLDATTQPLLQAAQAAGARLQDVAPQEAFTAVSALERAHDALMGRPERSEFTQPEGGPEARIEAAHARARKVLRALWRRLAPKLKGSKMRRDRHEKAAEEILPGAETRAHTADQLSTAGEALDAGLANYDRIAAALHAAAARMRESGGGDKIARAADWMEEAAKGFSAAFAALTAYRRAQRALSLALARRPDPDGDKFVKGEAGGTAPAPSRWLISDFVTIGSPLTYGDYLLTESQEEFAAKKARGLIPASPSADSWSAIAPFSAMRWTNLYFVANGVLNVRGDIIGGRLWPLFGLGVADVDLREQAPNNAVFSHNEYWKSALEAEKLRETPPAHVRAMRLALALAKDPDLDLAQTL